MRMLLTTTPFTGHINPLIPLARAARDAGHAVAFACAPSLHPTAERDGFATFPVGFDMRGRSPRDLFAGWHAAPPGEISYWFWRHMFVEVFAAAMVPDLLTLAREWRPDVIVREAAEHGGCVAAEVLDLPHASVRSGAEPSSFMLRTVIAQPLAALRARHGLPPDPDVVMPFRYLHLAAEPPGFLLPGDTRPPTAHLLRPPTFEDVGDGLPAWVAGLPDRPTIYVTLGTLSHTYPAARALFAAILAALRDEPMNLVVTVGRDGDAAQFGPQPPNVHIARYIPQSMLLPHCDLVIDQGGFNTVTGVLAAGLPPVFTPLGADQPLNAACCAALGAGRVLGPEERTPAIIRSTVRDVLANDAYRAAAERVRDEMAALPGPGRAVEILERLAQEKAPVLSG